MTHEFYSQFLNLIYEKDRLELSIMDEANPDAVRALPLIYSVNERILSLGYNCVLVDVSQHYSNFQNLIRIEQELINEIQNFVRENRLSPRYIKKLDEIDMKIREYFTKIWSYMVGRNRNECKFRIIMAISLKDFELVKILAMNKCLTDTERSTIFDLINALSFHLMNALSDGRNVRDFLQRKECRDLFNEREIAEIIKLTLGKKIPTRQEIEQEIDKKSRLDQSELPKMEPVDRNFSNLFEDIRQHLSEKNFSACEYSINARVRMNVINGEQCTFLLGLVDCIRSNNLDGAIAMLASEGPKYFEGYAHLEVAVNPFLQELMGERKNESALREVNEIRKKLSDIAEGISAIIDLLETRGIEIPTGITRIHHQIYSNIYEMEDYEGWYDGKPIQLYYSTVSTSPEILKTYPILSYKQFFIRAAERKIAEAVKYFSELLDRRITWEVVAFVDFCDPLAKEDEQLRVLINALINKSGLEDVTPAIGSRFDQFRQEVGGHDANTTRDIISRIDRRGFKYKSMTTDFSRKPSVIIGR